MAKPKKTKAIEKKKVAPVKKLAAAAKKSIPATKKSASPVKKASAPVKKTAKAVTKKKVSGIAAKAVNPFSGGESASNRSSGNSSNKKASHKLSTHTPKSHLTGKGLHQPSQKKNFFAPDSRLDKKLKVRLAPRKQGAPAPSQPAPARAAEIPDQYGVNEIYCLVRDPFWVFAYWEIQPGHAEEALKKLGSNWDTVSSVLRVFDLSSQGQSFFDVTLRDFVRQWYLQVEPDRSYVVEIGLRHPDGRYIMLARSNEITTPRAVPSDVIDEEWMSVDFDTLYALSGGLQLGKSSMELMQWGGMLPWHAISSGSGGFGMGSGSGAAGGAFGKKGRGFWFVLDCELIVTGATEPDASVLMNGRPVRLRPDGTFTLRYALPDGKLVLDAQAFSSDGIEERQIRPTVERRTERPAPKIKETAAR